MPAPPEEVFRLRVDPTAAHQWFIYRVPVHWQALPSLDARAGGKFDWKVVSDTNEREVFHFHGSYLEFHQNQTLVFTWNWQRLPIEGVDGPGRTVVEVALAPEGTNTRVTVTQTGLANEAARTAHEVGWTRRLEGMARLLPCREEAGDTL